jgi:hypothetical protein
MQHAPQDVIEVVVEFVGFLPELLWLRLVSSTWANAVAFAADVIQRKPSCLLLAGSEDEEPLVSRTLASYHPWVPPRRLLRLAVVLLGSKLEHLTVLDGSLRDLEEWVDEGHLPDGGLEKLSSLHVIRSANFSDAPNGDLRRVCPNLQTLHFRQVVDHDAWNVVASCPRLTELRLHTRRRSVQLSSATVMAACRQAKLKRLEMSADMFIDKVSPFSDPVAWASLTSLDFTFIPWVEPPAYHFPPTLRYLRLSERTKPFGYLPPELEELRVPQGQIPSAWLAPVLALRVLECGSVATPTNAEEHSEFCRVLGGLEALTVTHYRLDESTWLSALGANLKSLALQKRTYYDPGTFSRIIRCCNLASLDTDGEVFSKFLDDQTYGAISRLRLSSTYPDREALAKCSRLTDVSTEAFEYIDWTDLYTSSIPALAPLERLDLSYTSIVQMPHDVQWRHTLTFLDVSNSNFTSWSSLSCFTALRTLRAMRVPTPWTSIAAAYPAMRELIELAVSDRDDDNIAVMLLSPTEVVELARATPKLKRLTLPVGFERDDTLARCQRDYWRDLQRLTVFESGNSVEEERGALLADALEPQGGWKLHDDDIVWASLSR